MDSALDEDDLFSDISEPALEISPKLASILNKGSHKLDTADDLNANTVKVHDK